ncbi:hypothetical protein Micbo1qcDRAFT_208386 [Microdochium bolleyi]|uniref:Zn(2)-C6 fungal-type domain-containing protein n=1 Tax=Microdochium bolleyi TaxID=196109 RepID=A0A136IR84_9PEZI|nr:hypothetical protein Micbo1qcDRAFT_208386 [Microdochium bolleyi]
MASTLIQFRSGATAQEQQQQPRGCLTGRAYHSKSRAGCFACKKRHVRCDEGRPACSACRRLLLRCEYPREPHRVAKNAAPAEQQAMQRVLLPSDETPGKKQAPISVRKPPNRRETAPAALFHTTSRKLRLTRHLWTAEDSARAIVHSAFATFDPVGLTRSEVFSEILPRESLHRDCYRYVCLAIRDLSNSPNTALRANGFRALGRPEDYIYTNGSSSTSSSSGSSSSSSSSHTGKDRHLISAVGNYARALAAFRDALPAMAAPDVALATLCFAVLELLQGNFASRNAVMAAGVAVLRPHVVSPRGARADGATRYGLHPRYGDSRVLCSTECVLVRFVAAGVLGGLMAPPPPPPSDGQGGSRQTEKKNKSPSPPPPPLLPSFLLPETLPAPPPPAHEGQGKGESSHDALRRQWNAFHGTLESWVLSLHWAVSVGHMLDAEKHLRDQARLLEHMGVWQDELRRRQRRRLGTSSDMMTFRRLRAYLHCRQVAMAVTSHEEEEGGDVDFASLLSLACTLSPEIDGFAVLSFADTFLDCSILPVMSRQAALAVAADVSNTTTGTTTTTTTSRPSPWQPDRGQQRLAEQQLGLLDIMAVVVERAFDEHAEVLLGNRSVERQQRDSASSSPSTSCSLPVGACGAGCHRCRPPHLGSEQHGGIDAKGRDEPLSTWSGSLSSSSASWSSSSSSSSLLSLSSTSPPPPEPSLPPKSTGPDVFPQAHNGTLTSSSAPAAGSSVADPRSSPSYCSSASPSSSCHSPSLCASTSHLQALRQQQQKQSQIPHHLSGGFQVMPLRARKELTLRCIPMHVATAAAALREGVFCARVVA